MRSFTSTWRRNGRPPRLPSDIDVSWLEELITIERQIIDAGLTFEESIPSWRDAWAVEAEVSDEALLQHLHRRALVREVLNASVVIVTGIVTGIVRGIVTGIVSGRWPSQAGDGRRYLYRDIPAPGHHRGNCTVDVERRSGFPGFPRGSRGKSREIIIGDIIDAIDRGIDAIARSIDNTKRSIGDGYDATVAFVKSPRLVCIMIIGFSLLALFSISFDSVHSAARIFLQPCAGLVQLLLRS